ncbi:MAG: DEAD/DEAH box helicase family protein [Bacteroidota bacterium]
MLKDINFSPTNEYRSSSEYEPIAFFLEALSKSISFDLLLGYFSSSSINVLALGFANFLYRGGKVRIVANHFLSTKDKQTLIRGENSVPDDYNFSLDDYYQIRDSLSEYGKHFFNCLAWLLTEKKLEIVIIKPKERQGIAHYKEGLFTDKFGNKVRFQGSCNFTAFGLLENMESLGIKKNWKTEEDVNAISKFENLYQGIFDRQNIDFIYLDFQEIEEVVKTDFGGMKIDSLIEQEQNLLKKKREKIQAPILKKVIEQIEQVNLELITRPKFPYERPRDYQIEAYEAWKQNDYKGIFAMATGTGKTITSLNCLLNEYQDTGSYKAVIIVPTIALVNQWENECHKFNFKDIIKVNSKEKWSEKVSLVNTISHFREASFVIIITYASFYRKKFQSYFKNLSNNTLIIADEVHNIGTNKLLKILPSIHLQKRIGLSATPNRYYDDTGNEKIEEFFNSKYPYTFRFTMKQALEKGWLCKYTYYPHLVELDSEEFEEYIKISLQLMKFFDLETLSYKKSEEVEKLLMIRKRIIHKAKNKLIAFNQILQDEFDKKGHLKYTLVYVPEGTNPNYAQIDEHQEDDDELKLITDYTRTVSKIDFEILVKQYTAKTKNRDELIKNFEHGKIHVLTSMKCLDEGVDVPRSELAVFCASTGNPRQFIQRRGRVLRRHNDKTHAVIHDLVVVPQIGQNDKTYNMERSLVKKELERVKDFAALASNRMDTYEVLKNVLDFYSLNLYSEN